MLKQAKTNRIMNHHGLLLQALPVNQSVSQNSRQRVLVLLPAQEVPGLSRVGVSFQGLLQTLDGIAVLVGFVPELLHCVMHPAYSGGSSTP